MKDKKKSTKQLSPRHEKILEIRKSLLQQLETLLAEAGIKMNSPADETIFPELGDQASAEINRNFMLRLKERERKLIKKIDKAIEKIHAGTYGICDTCGQEISVKRLEARPVTTMCKRMHRIQREGSITLDTFRYALQQMGLAVAKHVADPKILRRIEKDWGAIVIDNRTASVPEPLTDGTENHAPTE